MGCTIESVTCVIKERVCWDFVAYATSRLQQGGVSQSSVLAARSAILRSQLNSSNKHLPDGMPLTHGTRGGICLYVLGKTTMDVQLDLENAIAGANTSLSMLSAYVAGRELCREIPDKLLHYVVDHHFCATGVAFASPYVAQEVIKRITMEQFMEVRLLIDGVVLLWSSEGALRVRWDPSGLTLRPQCGDPSLRAVHIRPAQPQV